MLLFVSHLYHSLYKPILCGAYPVTFKVMTAQSFLVAACATLMLSNQNVAAFAPMNTAATTKSSLGMSADSRRAFLDRVATTSAIVAAGLATGVTPANAIGGGINKVNAKLQG